MSKTQEKTPPKYNMNEALRKLSSQIYFDKQNLSLREELANFLSKTKEVQNTELKKIENDLTQGKFKLKKGDIDLMLLPKKVTKSDDGLDGEFFGSNFYTNQFYLQPASIDRVAVFIKASIRIHLISTLWLLKYGPYLDAELKDCCMGNRLALKPNKKEVLFGRSLFKRYEQQYQNWWSGGIKNAKALLEEKENVTIVNFDFKDYYHSVEFDFAKLEEHINDHYFKALKEIKIEDDPLHIAFVLIHEFYTSKLKEYNHPALNQKTSGKHPLPIGLMSSSVLGNWFLKGFDNHLLDVLQPVYYGRYVDDLMLVIKDTVIAKFDEKTYSIKTKIKENLDECETKKQKQLFAARYYVEKYFNSIFIEDKENYEIVQNKEQYGNIKLQNEKFHIYQFNAKLSPNLLHRFEEEQRERVSAFQFLSEDEDDVYKNLDEITFENNFDQSDVNSARFKNLDDNKYKLAVYLAKLIRGSVVCGNTYEYKETQKVKKFFKGYYLIKNFYFWEKLFALWMVREDFTTMFNLYAQIEQEIKTINLKEDQTKSSKKDLTKTLENHLENSFLMALGLYPDMINEQLKDNERTILNHLSPRKNLYRQTGLLRKGYIHFPLAQFTNKALTSGFSLFENHDFNDMDEDRFTIDTDGKACFPYRIKLYEAILLTSFRKLAKVKNLTYSSNCKYEEADFLPTEDILDEGFNLFYEINQLKELSSIGESSKTLEKIEDDASAHKSKIKKQYFQNYTEQQLSIKSNKSDNVNPSYIKIPNSGKLKNGKTRVCLVNKYVDARESEKSIEGKPVNDSERFEQFNKIWDQVKGVPNRDLFIMPELALPYDFIGIYTLKSVYEGIGFITGLEHLEISTLGFNLVYTCLPIEIDGDKDAIPLLRIKNHYAHHEEVWLQGKRMIVPKPKPYRYNLFEWRELYFTEYNCFELANIKHRNLFYGLTDVIFSPVWNKDMHYYNSMIESASRDLHTTIVLSNTTQYGDSRATIPADHVTRDKVRFKGGTVRGHNATIMVVDLDVDKMRYFQTHDYVSSVKLNKQYGTSYKPLPPDYPFEYAEKRHNKKLFELKRDII